MRGQCDRCGSGRIFYTGRTGTVCVHCFDAEYRLYEQEMKS